MGGAFAGIEKLLASPSYATWPLVDMGSHGATRSWMKTWFAFCPKECWMIGMTREWQYRFSLRNMVAREHSNRRRCHHRRVQGKIGQVWVFSYCVRSLFGHGFWSCAHHALEWFLKATPSFTMHFASIIQESVRLQFSADSMAFLRNKILWIPHKPLDLWETCYLTCIGV